jgi:uncharacterized membrane protein HdeD (DUF308 family)
MIVRSGKTLGGPMRSSRRGSRGQPGQPAAEAGEGQPVVPRQERPGYGAGPATATPRQEQRGGRAADQRLTAGVLGGLIGQAWPAVLAIALGMLAIGIMLLAWPRATLTVVAVLLGAALVIGGIFRLVEGFTARDASGATRAGDVLVGLVAVVAGLFCLRHHDETIFLLAFLLGAFWIIHGVADVAVVITARGLPGRGFRAIAGLFSIAAGCVVLFWPAISLVLLLTILAAWFLFYGLVLLFLAFQLFRLGRRGLAGSEQVEAAGAGDGGAAGGDA